MPSPIGFSATVTLGGHWEGPNGMCLRTSPADKKIYKDMNTSLNLDFDSAYSPAHPIYSPEALERLKAMIETALGLEPIQYRLSVGSIINTNPEHHEAMNEYHFSDWNAIVSILPRYSVEQLQRWWLQAGCTSTGTEFPLWSAGVYWHDRVEEFVKITDCVWNQTVHYWQTHPDMCSPEAVQADMQSVARRAGRNEMYSPGQSYRVRAGIEQSEQTSLERKGSLLWVSSAALYQGGSPGEQADGVCIPHEEGSVAGAGQLGPVSASQVVSMRHLQLLMPFVRMDGLTRFRLDFEPPYDFGLLSDIARECGWVGLGVDECWNYWNMPNPIQHFQQIGSEKSVRAEMKRWADHAETLKAAVQAKQFMQLPMADQQVYLAVRCASEHLHVYTDDFGALMRHTIPMLANGQIGGVLMNYE